MARTSIRERPDREEVLWPMQQACPACGHPMRLRYDNCRTLVTLAGPRRLRLKIRRCERDDCSRHHRPYRPEAKGAMALRLRPRFSAASTAWWGPWPVTMTVRA